MVARRAHNPKVVGSNPAPATNYSDSLRVVKVITLRPSTDAPPDSNLAPATKFIAFIVLNNDMRH